MANKTDGFKDARNREDMASTRFYPSTPIFCKDDIDEVDPEHREECVLVSWPIGNRERVFTESEVKAIIHAALGRMAVYNANGSEILRAVVAQHGIVLDPAKPTNP